MNRSIWIGWDQRECDAYMVAQRSIERLSLDCPPIHMLARPDGYDRPTERRGNVLWDVISDAPMSTEFAISRFCTPLLAKSGWALFMDCDFMARADIGELFDLADPQYAVMVVKHDQQAASAMKMDDQPQASYPRKNWSSLCLWNVEHPANARLTADRINTVPGRDLHRFCWLLDHEIGALPRAWNHLVGVCPPDPAAKLAHFTLGLPRMDGYRNCEFSQEWWAWHNRA